MSLAKAIEFILSSEAAEKNTQDVKEAKQLCVGHVAQANANVKPCCHKELICHTCSKKGHTAAVHHTVI